MNDARCRQCDADVLFLSTCPHCGASTGKPEPPVLRQTAAVPPVPAVIVPPALAESARPQNRAVKSGLPVELTRAWQGPQDRRSRTDEWTAAREGERGHNLASKGSHQVTSKRLLGAVFAALVALGAVAVGVSVATHTQQPVQSLTRVPQTFNAAGWVFQANFPSTPSAARLGASLYGKHYTETFYTSTSATDDMTVAVVPFPVGMPTMSADAFLRGFVGKAPKAGGGHLRTGRATEIQGLPSLWLAATGDGGNMATFGVVILDGHVAYEILVTGSAVSVNTAFSAAVHSFRIVDPAKGIVKF